MSSNDKEEKIKPLVEWKKCIFDTCMEKYYQKSHINENKVFEIQNHFNVR